MDCRTRILRIYKSYVAVVLMLKIQGVLGELTAIRRKKSQFADCPMAR